MNSEIDKDAKTVVIKIGGARLSAKDDLDKLTNHVNFHKRNGFSVAIVHGGGPEISELHQRLSLPFEKRNGLRVTGKKSMELVSMVLCGTVNKRIAAHFSRRGLKSIGLSGIDGGLLNADLLDESVYGRVGRNPEVKSDLLWELFSLDYVPVIAPVALCADGGLVNINADDSALAIAMAIGASSFDFITDIPGVENKEKNIIPEMTPKDIQTLIDNRVVRGGMIPKLQAAAKAVRSGVGCVRVGDFESIERKRATAVVVAI